MRTDVSALYVDRLGPYPKLVADWWDEKRDARNYAGPNPVVAHPPCGPYSKQRHNYRGAEHDCAPRALEQVRQFGGALEHPAESKFWTYASLPLPAKPLSLMGGHGWRGGEMYAGLMVETDSFGGFTVAVEQCAWGHVARKPTWLYFVGVDLKLVVDTLKVGGTPTHWCSGNRNNKAGGSVPPGIKVCSAQQRRRTPVAFAEWLIELASQAKQTARSA